MLPRAMTRDQGITQVKDASSTRTETRHPTIFWSKSQVVLKTMSMYKCDSQVDRAPSDRMGNGHTRGNPSASWDDDELL